MQKEEKEMLRLLVESEAGYQDVYSLGQNQQKIVQLLVAKGLADGFQHKNMVCYRATEKGHAVFYSLPQKLWFILKSDVRTIIVSITTALLTTIIISKLL